MAEAKELLKLLQFNLPEGKELKDIETSEIETHFNTNFVGVNVAAEKDEIKNKILGKELGTLSTKFKKMFEGAGVSFEGKEIKENDRIILDKVAEVGFAELTGQITNLKESSGKTNDKLQKELQEKLEALKSDYTTVLSERDNLKSTVEQKESEFSSFKTNLTLNSKIEEQKKGIEFSESVDKYKKKGFDLEFNEKYDIGLSDENDSEDGLRIVDKKTKARVSEGNKFVTLANLYKKELKEANMLKVAEQKKDPIRVNFNQRQDGDKKEIKVNPLAEQIAAGETKL